MLGRWCEEGACCSLGSCGVCGGFEETSATDADVDADNLCTETRAKRGSALLEDVGMSDGPAAGLGGGLRCC